MQKRKWTEEGSSEEEIQIQGIDPSFVSLEMEPFNMRDEMNTGRFENGIYISNSDSEAEQDNWLEGITQADIMAAALAQRARAEDEERRKTEQANTHNNEELLRMLSEYLYLGETVFSALSRLNKKINRPKRGMHVEESTESTLSRTQVENITEISNLLLQGGFNVYDFCKK